MSVIFPNMTRLWICVDLEPSAIESPTGNPPDSDEYQGFTFDRYDRSTEEQKFFIWHVPKGFLPGPNSVRGHYGFFVENPPSGSGNEYVILGYDYKKITHDNIFDFSSGKLSGVITETILDGESPYKWHRSQDGYCNTTNWLEEDLILFRFFRDATNENDTYDNEAVGTDNDVWIRFYHLEYLAKRYGGII